MLKNKKKKDALKAKIEKLINKGKTYLEIAKELKVKVDEVKATLKAE